jgi:hypothetical protein
MQCRQSRIRLSACDICGRSSPGFLICLALIFAGISKNINQRVIEFGYGYSRRAAVLDLKRSNRGLDGACGRLPLREYACGCQHAKERGGKKVSGAGGFHGYHLSVVD